MTVGEFKTRVNKHSHIECIVYIVTGRIQNRSKLKFLTIGQKLGRANILHFTVTKCPNKSIRYLCTSRVGSKYSTETTLTWRIPAITIFIGLVLSYSTLYHQTVVWSEFYQIVTTDVTCITEYIYQVWKKSDRNSRSYRQKSEYTT